MDTTIKIDGLDMLDVMNFISKKKNKFLAIMLQDLEMEVPRNSPEYIMIRKIILDGINDYTRSLLKVLFGDVEGLVIR